jgi:hypothetical protein
MRLQTLTLLLAGLAPLGALAQANPAPAAATSPSSAQSEAGEPRAMTSDAAPAPAAEPAPAPTPRPSSGRPAAGSAAGARAPAGTAPGGKAAADRLELGTATVTGDREQPKVMYIVPWKKSDIGDLSGKPMNSLLDEALAPVDRDEFKRQVMYYQVVKADASQNGAAKTPAVQGEK